MDPQSAPTPSEPEQKPANEPVPQQPTIIAPDAPATPASAAPAAVVSPTVSTTPTPKVDAATVVSSASPTGMVMGGSGRDKRKRMIIAVVALVVLLIGGYAFAFYIPNLPSVVLANSLKNTGKAVDQLLAYSKTQDTKSYKSSTFDSTMNFKSSSLSFDASLSGAFDKDSNGNLQFKADIEGQNVTADLRSIKAAGNTSPDLYFQVSGVKSYLDSAGLNAFDSLDGQWIAIDHTLLDTYSASLKQSLNSSTNSSVANASSVPTAAQLNDALDKVQVVNKQYIFSTSHSTGVLNEQKFVGKETQNGRSVNHYKIGYNKAHLQAYVSALSKALDGSSLNSWSIKANSGKSLSDVLGIPALQKSISSAKTNYTFDAWADTKTKLLSSLKFTSTSDPSSSFTISQSYTGGTKYPLGIATSDKTGTAKLDITVDSSTNKVNGDFAVTSTGSDASSLTGSFNVTPGNSDVSVTVPSGAVPITNVLNQFGLGGLLATPGAADTTAATDPFALTQ